MQQNRKLPSLNRNNYEPPEGYLAIGYVVGVHGLRGEVKVELYTDFPERFEAGITLLVGEKLKEMRIESSRVHKNHLLLKLEQIQHREQAEALRNQWILIAEEDAVELDDDLYFVHEILGLRVVTTDGESLGEIVDVIHTGANDVYVIALDTPIAKQKELLIPAVADVVKNVDLEQETITVSLLPGMLEMDSVTEEG